MSIGLAGRRERPLSWGEGGNAEFAWEDYSVVRKVKKRDLARWEIKKQEDKDADDVV